MELVEAGRPWSFDGDGALFRLVSEAQRILLAHLFDPVLAVHTSLVEPLPHQVTAVYEAMLPRQPLRFLLADDPGAGKTIMAGLFIKELIARGDLKRCLVVCPGSLAEQWQDELVPLVSYGASGHIPHPRRRGERGQAWLFYIGGSGDRRGPFNDSVNVRFSEAGRITPSDEADF